MNKTRIKDLPGLGEKSEQSLAMIGIERVDQFLALDPFDIYKRLKEAAPETSLIMLYAIIGAQEDKDWQQVKSESKTEILMRLDDMGLAPK